MTHLNAKIDQRRVVSFNSPGMRRILNVLQDSAEPLDGRQIADQAHISFRTFQNGYRHALIRAGLMHIAEFRNNPVRGPFVPAYRAGPGPKKAPAKPPKITSASRSQRWKFETGYNEKRKADRRLVRPADPIMAALLSLPRRHTTGAQP